MLLSRWFLLCVSLLLLLTGPTGCVMLNSDAWGGPSILTTKPLPPPDKHEASGGFSVVVDAPDQPAGSRVFADIRVFAQGRGFIRQSPASTTFEQYALGDIKLDINYRTADLRVAAYLHSFSSQLNGRFVDRFYRDFAQQHAAQYGEHAPIIEDSYTDDDPNGATRNDHSGGRSGRR